MSDSDPELYAFVVTRQDARELTAEIRQVIAARATPQAAVVMSCMEIAARAIEEIAAGDVNLCGKLALAAQLTLLARLPGVGR